MDVDMKYVTNAIKPHKQITGQPKKNEHANAASKAVQSNKTLKRIHTATPTRTANSAEKNKKVSGQQQPRKENERRPRPTKPRQTSAPLVKKELTTTMVGETNFQEMTQMVMANLMKKMLFQEQRMSKALDMLKSLHNHHQQTEVQLAKKLKKELCADSSENITECIV